MQRWASHFMTMLEHIVREPETSIQAISMLTAAERDRILSDFNGMTDKQLPEKQFMNCSSLRREKHRCGSPYQRGNVGHI